MKKTILIIFTLFIAFNTIKSQTDDSHSQAVIELMTIMDMKTILSESISTMLDAQINANPAMAKYKSAMTSFLQKYMSYEAIKNDLVKIYKEEFSESEVRDIIEFYKTKTGMKALKSFPKLMQKGAALGQSRIQENLSELQELIQKVDEQNYN